MLAPSICVAVGAGADERLRTGIAVQFILVKKCAYQKKIIPNLEIVGESSSINWKGGASPKLKVADCCLAAPLTLTLHRPQASESVEFVRQYCVVVVCFLLRILMKIFF